MGYDLLKEAQKAQESITQLRTKVQQLVQEGDTLRNWTEEMTELDSNVSKMLAAGTAARMPFSWVDGPLVEAMKQGDIILVDELNLAEDAVLERMNRWVEIRPIGWFFLAVANYDEWCFSDAQVKTQGSTIVNLVS